VDSDREAVAAVKDNLAAVGLPGGVVQQSDVLAYLRRTGGGDFDLVFADPPYAFDGWDELFELVTAPVLVAESDRELEPPAPWEVIRWKRYGGTVVTLAERT
jgi:16S rRNA (guanine966-N2)-methyltransferase